MYSSTGASVALTTYVHMCNLLEEDAEGRSVAWTTARNRYVKRCATRLSDISACSADAARRSSSVFFLDLRRGAPQNAPSIIVQLFDQL